MKTRKPPPPSISFDELMTLLNDEFEQWPDHRAANTTYDLADILRSAFAMFSLKSPSLLAFREQTQAERHNLETLYRIGSVARDTQMRAALDPLDPGPVRALFAALFERLRAAGVVAAYEYWDDFVIVSVDGVHHFSSTKIHCPHCTTRTHRTGVTSYHHGGLAAVMVHPNREEVFPLDFEPVLNGDGARKNDCERTAAKRLVAALHQHYPDLDILLVEDALYANAPHIRQITQYGWHFILTVTPESHQSLERQFAGRQATDQVRRLRLTDPDGVRHEFAWTNGLCLCDSATDVVVNYLLYEQTNPDGQTTRWTWITDLPLSARTVERIMRAGRSRWKIENETFNTLKNQGYHFEHNYGHGFQNLATILALLMFLAFAVDQILQACWDLFQQVRAGLRTKAKLWDTLRSLFRVLKFPSMSALYRRMAALYLIQIE